MPHKRLISKLNHYGIRGKTSEWVRNFLSNRTQCVVLDGIKSGDINVESGVPQGTVLGPILFLIFINDIPDNIKSNVRLFADDCLVYREINNHKDSLLLQEDLYRLEEWAKLWQMEFNVDKCFIMRISLSKTIKCTHSYKMGGTTLQVVPANPYLGVQLDNKMSFRPHIQGISSKGTRLLNFLRRNMKKCPPTTKEKTYQALVRPGIEYCAPIWDPHQQYLSDGLEKVQRKAARFVLNKPYRRSQRDSVSAMISQLGWESLSERRAKLSVTLFYKVVNRLVEVPQDYLPTPATRCTRRSQLGKYIVPSSNINAHKSSFMTRTVRIWNNLPSEMTAAPTLDSFKDQLRLTSLSK